MIGIILAAGMGTRMGTAGIPKCLLTLDDSSIIKYQIKCFNLLGINNILVITGYNSELIKNHLGPSLKYVYAQNYAKTNNLHSIWAARDFILDDFVCVYGDLLFHMEILRKCLRCKENICLMIDKKVRGETMKVKIKDEKVLQVNKLIPFEEADGNFIGMAKFTSAGRKLLFDEISDLVKQGNFNAYYTLAIENLIKKGQIVSFSETTDYPWMDIDDQSELEKARNIFKKIDVDN